MILESLEQGEYILFVEIDAQQAFAVEGSYEGPQ
jgi:hypothetical protein